MTQYPSATPPAPYSGSAYGQSAASYHPTTELPEHPQATIAMVLGIIGVCGFHICAPIAWYLASKAKKEIAAAPGTYQEGGSLQAGYVMGIIGTIMLILAVIIVIFYILMLVGILGWFSSML